MKWIRWHRWSRRNRWNRWNRWSRSSFSKSPSMSRRSQFWIALCSERRCSGFSAKCQKKSYLFIQLECVVSLVSDGVRWKETPFLNVSRADKSILIKRNFWNLFFSENIFIWKSEFFKIQFSTKNQNLSKNAILKNSDFKIKLFFEKK